MTFVDLSFIGFLLASILIFYICPVKHRWLVLLGASIAFYAIAGVKFLPFIFITSLTIYLAALGIGKVWTKQENALSDKSLDRAAKKQIKESHKKKARAFLILAIVFNIGILCVSKYTKFLIEPINGLISSFSGTFELKASHIIVPLGISYYTFSSVGYLLDVYWKRYSPEKNYARFALYLIYFPHILQGPIERYNRLGERLKQELRFDYKRVSFGIQLMLWGYFKKLVIADRANMFISSVFDNINGQSGITLLVALALDVVYIYTDFSGCMDIARGVSQIFGVELDLNFNHPFFSKTVTEFWRRWHMSLGGWFRDYVYYSISTSKKVKNLNKSLRKKLPDSVTRVIITAIPVTITWVLTGVWHGSGMGYVMWGVYYAVLITISIALTPELDKLFKRFNINTETTAWKFMQMFKVFCIFAGGRLCTSPGSLRNSYYVIKGVFTRLNIFEVVNGVLLENSLNTANWFILLASIALLIVVSVYQEKGSVRERLSEQNAPVSWIMTFGLLFAILVFGIYGPNFSAASFVYMVF